MAKLVVSKESKKASNAAYRAAHIEEIKAYSKTYWTTHKEERKAYMAVYLATHREEIKTYRLIHREEKKIVMTAKRYNVSLREAELLIALRDGEGAWCDICRTTEAPFHLDHDHKTGKIRGLLCSDCNRRIEGLENGFPIQVALEYLGVPWQN